MPKRTDIKKVMVIGSGPIVIGQAAEFDYAGTQACIALKEEGYQVVLVNSNPATIMTDTNMAHKVYLEPLDLEHVARIIRHERPDGLICGLGGQTALNLGIQLQKKGILDECQVQILGTSILNIETAEDRKLFKEFCQKINEPVIQSHIATSIEEAVQAAANIGYPVVLRPAFTLGGTGGGFSYNESELVKLADNALKISPTAQVLIEKSIKGFKEIEFEVVRDAKDNTIIIAGMENVDPVGVHTGDSIVVAPTQTLSPQHLKMLEESALKIVRSLKIEGGCNVQLALDPNSSQYYIIEVNPRLSRSSALASKAAAYPIARVATKIACGLSLDEILVAKTPASVSPKLDYLIAKFPRFPFDKFNNADRRLSTQMKATGEVMSIGRSMEEVILKAVRSLELGLCHLHLKSLDTLTDSEIMEFITKETDERIYAIAEALRRGVSVEDLAKLTAITVYFLESIKRITETEKQVKDNVNNISVLRAAKEIGFSDEYIASVWNCSFTDIYNLRYKHSLLPVYKMTDNGGSSSIPYFYSTYTSGDHGTKRSARKKVIVLGSGPIRIGQGVEFDYGTVHAVWALQQMGYEAIVINNNPETVSTDYTLSDKLYFEPLTFEDVMGIVDFEKPIGVICALGGQTAINLAGDLTRAGVKILGTDSAAIDRAEDRDLFAAALTKLKIPMPHGKGVTKTEEAVETANKVGYPVLVRPSFVLGGRMMHIVGDEATLIKRVSEALRFNPKHPVLVDKYIMGKECEVDAVCDGKDVFIPGIMEHIERAGVHSGDSISVYPTFSLSSAEERKIINYTNKIGLGLGIIGPYNIQFIIDAATKKVYVIEVNPRSSRTVPFFAKVIGVPVASIATKVMLGKTLEELGTVGVPPKRERWFVKTPAFSFSKLAGLDAVLSPEMKSTGETIGYDKQLSRAVYKSMKAAGISMVNYGTVLVTVHDTDKEAVLPLVKRFYNIGFNIVATKGTAAFLKQNGIRTRMLPRLSEGDDILRMLRNGHVSYVINTTHGFESKSQTDGACIRWTAAENKVPTFTCLDTVQILLDVIEDITIGVSTINS